MDKNIFGFIIAACFKLLSVGQPDREGGRNNLQIRNK